MIYSYLCGGLGNQMFEYACAYALAKEYSDDIVFNTIQLDKDGLRKLGLSHFDLDRNVRFINEKVPFHDPMSIPFRMARKLSMEASWIIGLPRGNWFWKAQFARELPKKVTKNVYLDGYWQAEKYFKKYSVEIRRQFIVKQSEIVTPGYEELLKDIKNSNSVCVHVRLGDYLLYPERQVCNPEYYKRGIEYLVERYKDARVFLFSDEPDKVRTLGLCSDTIYVSKEFKDYESLSLMGNCAHYVISNSSFSWWAQYLGNRDGKTVIAPKQWIKGIDRNDMADPNWIILD